MCACTPACTSLPTGQAIITIEINLTNEKSYAPNLIMSSYVTGLMTLREYLSHFKSLINAKTSKHIMHTVLAYSNSTSKRGIVIL